MSETVTQASPVTVVAGHLTEIEDMAARLREQAIHDANDREMPGGAAMVALASVASPEAWEFIYEAEEALGRDVSRIDDEDDTWEPPLQTLLFWSEQWRAEHGMEFEPEPHRPYPTIGTEANFIRWALNWAWDHEVKWEDFARDIRKARARLQDVLSEGKRNQRGVQCFDCRVDLLRRSEDRREHKHCSGHDGVCGWPHKFCPHDRGGLRDEWVCPECQRTYGVEDYHRAVQHAHFIYADYLTLNDAAERTDVKAGTIKVWANRGKVRKRKDQDTGRMTYHVGDIARHAGSEEVA